MSDGAQVELQRMIEARLARFGAVGSVSIEAGLLKLEGGGPSACVPIERLLERWDRLAFAERESECALLASALQRQRRAPRSVPERRGSAPWGWLAIGVGLLVAAAALRRNIVSALAGTSVAAQPAIAPSAPLDADAERRRHAATVCEATRARLARGGLVGGSDVEGWVVELSLVGAVPGADWPSLEGFFSPPDARGSRISWRGSPELSAIQGGETQVQVADLQWPEEQPRFRERRFTFLGGYVLPYFHEREQIQFVRLGHALAERHGA
ncbi:MAG TPA: hypothetical protein VG963_20130, partial [Polyangiaceae bacterium]|nr:hypothetical protein [Polyangiaceae bacterium]